MNVQDLLTKLTADGAPPRVGASLELGGDFLRRVGAELDTSDARFLVWPYFPAGKLRLGPLEAVTGPEGDGWITLLGVSQSPPMSGMSVRLRLGVLPAAGAEPAKLMLLAEAFLPAGRSWSLVDGFPIYASSPLAALVMVPSGDGVSPLMRLASHAVEAFGVAEGMWLAGELDLRSLAGTNHGLFLGMRAAGQDRLPVQGPLWAFPPEDSAVFPEAVLPKVVLRGRMPSPPASTRNLGGVFSLQDLWLGARGEPRYNTATARWQIESELTWHSDLVLSTRSGEIRIPIGVTVPEARGRMLVWSRPGEGPALGLPDLGAIVPGAPLAVPTRDFEIAGAVKLARLEMMLDTEPGADLIEYVELEIETSEQNRWVLVERVLALDAINVRFLVARPASAERSVEVSLSGLVGIGERGTLALTASFSRDAGVTDYQFHGELLNDAGGPGPGPNGESLEMVEVLTHFLGRDEHPGLPSLWVRSFWFTLAPRTKTYAGFIKLCGEWAITDSATVVLQDLSLSFSRAGEGATGFKARGAFRFGKTVLFVAADYASGARGWIFEGGTEDGSKMPIGALVGEAARLLGAAPSAIPATIEGLSLSDIGVRFDTATKDFSFRGTASFPVDGDPQRPSEAKLTVHVDLRHPPGATPPPPRIAWGGRLDLYDRVFAVEFDSSEGADDLLVASYSGAKGDEVDLRELVAQISIATAAWVPRLRIALEHAQLAFARKPGAATGHRFLFGVELGAGVELSKLPLVGSYFDASQTLSVVVKLVVANADFSLGEVQRINQRSAPAATKFPDEGITVASSNVNVKTALRLGGKSFPLGAPLAWQSPTDSAPKGSIVSAPGSSSFIQWFSIQQAFGAFHFERVGIGLTADRLGLELVLDASVELGGLTLTLAGLGAECSFADIGKGDLGAKFHLDGLGVDFACGDLKIGGALLRTAIPGRPHAYTYDGAVAVHHQKISFVAIGSYADLEAAPSLFVYALIDYPLGGPPFFYVEGLVFGFGYNRALTVPPLEEIATFPLVALARKAEPDLTPADVARRIAKHVAPAEGEYFVAAGVEFSSFKTIEGVVLLVVSYGRRLHVDVIGIATLTSPPRAAATGQPLLMKAELGLRARYQPDEGVLSVRGELMPDAYLFSEACHLTGGFAFCSWFKDQPASSARAGDFVLTLGGYHPKFLPPPHYPKVPRLGLSWQVNENLALKADAYFALTPSAIMAGGHLRANWQSDDLHAWFDAEVDCLLAWLPYHYDARADVSIGVSYRTRFHTFHADLTAKLQIWGPPFSGLAHVSFWIFSFDIAFGDSKKHVALRPSWAELRRTLPAEVLAVTAEGGKVVHHGKTAAAPARSERDDLGVINPRELRIAVTSAIPITSGWVLSAEIGRQDADLGIAPMGKPKLESRISVIVHRGAIDVGGDFELDPAPHQQRVPVALWGRSSEPTPNEPALVPARTGLTIRPKSAPVLAPPANPEPSHETTQLDVLASEVGARFAPAAGDARAAERVRDSVQRPEVRLLRQRMLSALLPDAELDWSGITVEAWRSPPRLVEVSATP